MSNLAPTPAQMLLERILGGLQAQMLALRELPLTDDVAKAAEVNEQLQNEIIQLDADQIPEAIREAYDALHAHGKNPSE